MIVSFLRGFAYQTSKTSRIVFSARTTHDVPEAIKEAAIREGAAVLGHVLPDDEGKESEVEQKRRQRQMRRARLREIEKRKEEERKRRALRKKRVIVRKGGE